MFKKLLKIFGLIVLALILLIAVLYYYPEPKIKMPELNEISALDEYLAQVVSDNKLPSIAVAIFDSSGIQKISAVGLRKKGGSNAVTGDDLFHLGSNTKAMTSVLTGMMIDEGLLNWGTSILEIFPELKDEIHSDFHDVIIGELLTHTSGIKANFNRTDRFLDLEIQPRRLAIIKKNLKNPTDNKKGEYLYSNLGYIIAGAILERISNKSWESLMKEKIFTPLQMTSAGFGAPGTRGKEDQPWGHIKVSALLGYVPLQEDNPEALGPAGTVHCSMEDWTKFITFQLMNTDTTLLSSKQRSQLLHPIKNDYACGWAVREASWADGIVYSHAGSNTMNFSQSWTVPEMNMGIMINSNSSSKNTSAIFREIRNALLKVIK